MISAKPKTKKKVFPSFSLFPFMVPLARAFNNNNNKKKKKKHALHFPVLEITRKRAMSEQQQQQKHEEEEEEEVTSAPVLVVDWTLVEENIRNGKWKEGHKHEQEQQDEPHMEPGLVSLSVSSMRQTLAILFPGHDAFCEALFAAGCAFHSTASRADRLIAALKKHAPFTRHYVATESYPRFCPFHWIPLCFPAITPCTPPLSKQKQKQRKRYGFGFEQTHPSLILSRPVSPMGAVLTKLGNFNKSDLTGILVCAVPVVREREQGTKVEGEKEREGGGGVAVCVCASERNAFAETDTSPCVTCLGFCSGCSARYDPRVSTAHFVEASHVCRSREPRP